MRPFTYDVPMPMDPELRAALDAAVEADPRNAALRVHLAELLAASEQFDEALRHARVLLEQDPANALAMSVASRAAR